MFSVRELEPYFAPGIKTLAHVRISCLPKSSPPPKVLCHSPVTVTRRPPNMSGALSNDLPNGNHNIDGPDSPATPVDNSTIVDIKIDVDIPPADSDLRSEPVQMNVDELDQVRDASTVPQLDTPQDPGELYRTLFTSDTP